MTEDCAAGIILAIKCLQAFEGEIDPSIDSKTAVRLARESIQAALDDMTGVKNAT